MSLVWERLTLEIWSMASAECILLLNYYTVKIFKLSRCYNLRTICKNNEFGTQDEDKMRNGDGQRKAAKVTISFFKLSSLGVEIEAFSQAFEISHWRCSGSWCSDLKSHSEKCHTCIPRGIYKNLIYMIRYHVCMTELWVMAFLLIKCNPCRIINFWVIRPLKFTNCFGWKELHGKGNDLQGLKWSVIPPSSSSRRW